MSEQTEAQVCQGQHTALHRAAMVGNSDAMAALIRGGCAVDLQDRDGNTALHEVSWHGFSHCVKLLVKAGADVHIRNKTGNTALHLACQNAHGQTAHLLLLGRSKPDTKNNLGDTCLHVAARYNNMTLVKMLLCSLCSVTERNQLGDTALHVAAALNHKRTVQLLLEAGTDGTIRNNVGKTALEKACDNNHKDVATLLARDPQVHRFKQGKTISKQGGRQLAQTAECRTRSVTQVEIQQDKDASSVAEGSLSSEQTERGTISPAAALLGHQYHSHQQHYPKIPSVFCSPYSHYKRRKAINNDDLRKRKNDPIKKDLLCDEDSSAHCGRAYQLYTLYRDTNGKIRQAPASGCHCKPLLKKLEGQMKVTEEEMKDHILKIQEKVNSRLGKMDRRSRHQIRVLDMLNQERAVAERKNMIYRIEQRVAQGREETLMKQAAVSHELKRWCMSQLNDMDTSVIPAKGQYYKLEPSASVDQSVADTDLESLPLLSLVSGDSSTSLATYVNIPPSKSTSSLRYPRQEQLGNRTYFKMNMDRSSDDYENTTLFHLAAENSSGLFLGTVDPVWQPLGLQHGAIAAAVVSQCAVEGFSNSSSLSSSSDQGHQLIQHQEDSFDRQYRQQFGELNSTHLPAGIHTEGTRTLEFFIDRPSEPTFSQERNNLHAKEVTQRFFDTVSAQLELWYERKIVQVEQEMEQRAQQDREKLMQRINMLEEELQSLKTNENSELCPESDKY